MPEDTSKVERDLAQLDYSLRKNKDSSLYKKYSVGFQLLKNDDDDNSAVGVHVFKIPDNLLLYAPIFFLDGQPRGMSLLYVKGKDFFTPFTDDWIAYLLSKQPLTLGEAAEDGADGALPDLSVFGNIGSSPSPGMEFGKAKRASLGNAIKRASEMISAYTKSGKKIALPNIDITAALKKADDAGREGLCSLMLSDIKVAEYFVNKLKGNIRLLRPKSEPIFKFAEEAKPTKKAGVAVVIERKEAPYRLTEQEVVKLKTQKYVVQDYREPSEASSVMDLTALNFIEPSHTGLYSTITPDGKIKEYLYIVPETHADRYYSPKPTVVDLNGKKSKETPYFFGLNTPESVSQDYWKEMYDGLSSSLVSVPEIPDNTSCCAPPSMHESYGPENYPDPKRFIIVGPTLGQAYGPFYGKNKVTLSNGHTEIEIACGKIVFTTSQNDYAKVERFTGYDNEKVMVVPGTFKTVPTAPDRQNSINLLSQTEAYLILVEGTSRLRISKQAGFYAVEDDKKEGAMTALKPKTMKLLVETYGLTEKAAEQTLKEAEHKSIIRLIKKAAPPMGPMGGMMMPPPPMPPMPGGMMDPMMMGGMPPMGPGGMPPMGPPPGMPLLPMPEDPAAAQAAMLAQQAMAGGQDKMIDLAGLCLL